MYVQRNGWASALFPEPEYAAADDPEPEFDLVEPRAVRRSVVEDEAIPMALVPLGNEIAFGCVAVRVQVVENDMNTRLRVRRRYEVHEGEEVRPLPARRASTQDLACPNVEARKEATSAIPLVFELEATVSAGSRELQLAATRQRLYPSLLVDRHDRLALRRLDVELHDATHLLLVRRILAVTPHLDSIRLDVGFFKDLCDRAPADRTDESRGHNRTRQRRATPKCSLKAILSRRAAGGGDDLMALKGRDDLRSPGARHIQESVEPSFLKTVQPFRDSVARRLHLPRNRRYRRPRGCQENHAGTSIQTKLTGLTPDNLCEFGAFVPGQLEGHASLSARALSTCTGTFWMWH